MKNLSKFLVILLLAFMFTSCVDYVQSISYKDGKYHIYYKITLSKLIFAMADEDPEEMFENYDVETLDGMPETTIVKPINTELEVGEEFYVDINPRTKDDEEKTLLPKISGNKCFIPFALGSSKSFLDSDDYSSGSDAGFAEAIMSSAKCRVLIGKNLLPSIEIAYFEGKGGKNYSIPVYDYGESYCFEIPFIVLMQDGMYRTDRIVVIKE